MNAVRRRLASGALALTVLQLALLFTAPVSACCQPFRVKAEATRVEKANAPDCCPPGSHAPGQCPLHRGSKSEDRGSAPAAKAGGDGGCRMMCDAPDGPQFLPGAVGVVPAPQSIEIDLTAYALHIGAPLTATARPSLPDAPPPRLL
jgi:hypothetical protein